MRNAYTTFASSQWPVFKRYMRNKSEAEFCRFAGVMPEIAQATGRYTPEEWICTQAATQLLFLWRYRKIQHFFLAPGVASFCSSCVHELSEEYCKRLPECEDVLAPAYGEADQWMVTSVHVENGRRVDKMQGGFAIHFPSSERRRSLMVVPSAVLGMPRMEEWRGPAFATYATIAKYYVLASDGQEVAVINENPTGLSVDGGQAIPRLIFGLSLYMDAFPDVVVPTRDGEIHHAKHYEGQRNYVRCNEVANTENKNASCPYWRRGHPRTLRSERFIRKKGQTIWIDGFFVKGKAFDVLGDTPTASQRRSEGESAPAPDTQSHA